MARKRMVSRSIKSTLATLMVVNLNTAEVENKVVEIASTFKTVGDVEKYIDKNNVLEKGYKCVQVVSIKEDEQLYGMLEQDFLKMAHKLDDKRNIIDEEDEEAEEV